MDLGNAVGVVLGIPCKDVNNGCECNQCKEARATRGNVVGNFRPCKDFNEGCQCNQCMQYRRSSDALKAAGR